MKKVIKKIMKKMMKKLKPGNLEIQLISSKKILSKGFLMEFLIFLPKKMF